MLKEDAERDGQDIRFSKIWMATTCFIDTVGSTLSLLSLILMPASL